MNAPTRPRIAALDRLRGLVMILMAIDHVRDFVGPDVPFRDIDVGQLGAGLFLTRWITHFCAPVFVLLAGMGAGLQLVQGKAPAQVHRFLVTRGLVLILLEFTVIRFAWTFDATYRSTFLGVIWALGASMIALAPLVGRSPKVVLGLGLAIVLGHDALDGVRADSLGVFGPIFAILHEPHGYAPIPGHRLFFLYPLLPWFGVMACGYGLALWLEGAPERRTRRLLAIGLGAIAGFFALRGINAYGDPSPWPASRSAGLTLLEMLDCTKYPPSLAYLLMTLGPAMLGLVLLEHVPSWSARLLEALGRAPLFYYVLHLYLAHAGALLLYALVYGERARRFASDAEARPRFSLLVVYAASALVVVALLPACRWFGELKRRRRDLAWLSYF